MMMMIALRFRFFGDLLHGKGASHGLSCGAEYGPEVGLVGLINHVTRERGSVYAHIDPMRGFLGAKAGFGRLSEVCAA